MTERRAIFFEIEEPVDRPRVRPPHHPRWERLLPTPWRRARRQRRTEAAFEEWQERVRAWEAAGRVQRVRYYAPSAEVTVTENPDGTENLSVVSYPPDSLRRTP